MQKLTPEQYKAKYGDGGAWAAETSGKTQEPSLFGRITNTLKAAADKEADIFRSPTSPGQIVPRAFEAVATAFNTIPKAGYDVLPKPARQGLDYVGGKIADGFNWFNENAGKNPFNPSGSHALIDDPLYQKFANSNAGQNTATVAGTLSSAGQIAGDILTANQVAKGAQKAVDLTKQGAQKVATTAKQTASNTYDAAAQAGSDLRNRTQLLIAKKNVNPQLEASSRRLFLDGTKRLDDPITTYDKYLAQSKKAITDTKIDPAIAEVGTKMGDAFNQVIKQRSAVGKILGEELKSNGKVKINITDPKTALLTELKDSGLSYNPKTKSLTSFQGSKFVPQEVKMLNGFVKGVQALGDNPTVAQVDSFITKIRTSLAFTKGESGVIGTTNAERIINGGIARLKESLNPQINGNQALAKYWDANNTYSDLSNFVDEGSTFLGKKTLSGDFAKDASVAKSSVQSILNQGKKDFMVKLEELTGYKALDEAVLALQAMKDAGDFRGLSLLQAMSESGIPTSKAGFTQKILDAAIKKGGEVVAGTPEQQTRAFLQDLLKNDQAASPSTIAPTIKASTGAKTSNVTKTSKSNISSTVSKVIKRVKDAQNGPDSQAGFIRIRKDLASSTDPMVDTGSAFNNRLNKYETQALANANDAPLTDRVQVFRSPLGTTTLPKRTLTPKGESAIPNQLATEARKYKSAEEFVKAQPKLYHGGTADIAEVKLGKGRFDKTFYLSENADYAKSYGGSRSTLNEMVIDPTAKLADMRKPTPDLIAKIEKAISGERTGKTIKIQKPDGTYVNIPEIKGANSNAVYSNSAIIQGLKDGKAMYAELPEVKAVLRKLGYDGQITAESKFGSNYGVWNKDVIKTKSQLTDIWKKANAR